MNFQQDAGHIIILQARAREKNCKNKQRGGGDGEDYLQGYNNWGAWVAQSVGQPTLAQVMISQSVSLSPSSGSVLTTQSLKPVWDSVSPSLSDPPPFMLCVSLSQK